MSITFSNGSDAYNRRTYPNITNDSNGQFLMIQQLKSIAGSLMIGNRCELTLKAFALTSYTAMVSLNILSPVVLV